PAISTLSLHDALPILPLKGRLAGAGHKFVTQTDTEVVAHLVESHLDGGGLESAVRKALAEMEGIYALVLMHTAEPQKLVAARRGDRKSTRLNSSHDQI